MKYVAVHRDISNFRKPLGRLQIDGLCRHAFGHRAVPRSCQLIGEGKFNTSYRIEFDREETVILRVAPPEQAILFQHEQYLLRRESSVQPVLNALSGKTPRNLFVDFSRRFINRDYVFQNCLKGELWDEIKHELSDEANADLWGQLGVIVKDIHGQQHDQFGPPAPLDQFDYWSQAVISGIRSMLDDMRHFHILCQDSVEFLQAVEAGRPHLDKITQPRLVHGDLWQKNILVERKDGRAEITAVLDAERAFWGDREAEWIFSFVHIPASFWQFYGALGSDHSAIFRRLVYEGRGAMQLCLEAWRFHFDDSRFRKILRDVARKLASFDTPGSNFRSIVPGAKKRLNQYPVMG